MRRTSRWIIFTGLIALLLITRIGFRLLSPAPKPDYGVNLLKNSGFEELDEAGMPRDWLSDAYNRLPRFSQFESVEGQSGRGVLVRNLERNDARFMQTVAVLPNTIYRLSGYVNASVLDGRGASLSIADVYQVNESVMDTGGAWQFLEVYGKTAADQRELTVYARVGGYSADSRGEAAFDDVQLAAVESAPPGVSVDSWQIYTPTPKAEVPAGPRPAWPYLMLIALLYVLAAVWMARKLEQRDQQPDLAGERDNSKAWLLILLAIAFLSRLLLGALIHGYGVDIGCFTGWANQMAAVGPADFYLSDMYSDYPPGYMLVLWPIGWLGKLLGTGATPSMVKLPAAICDVLAAAMLYRFAKERMKPAAALWLAALYAFNPLTYLTGAAWGQVDSVPALLILLVVIQAMKGRWSLSLPLFVLAVLMKPQALMFGPLGLVAVLLDLFTSKEPNRFKEALIGVGGSLLVAAVIILPFSLKQGGLSWLIKLYSGTMNLYSYATVNATNLYFLFGFNWQGLAGDIALDRTIWLRLAGGLMLIIPGVLYIVKLWQSYEGKRPSSAKILPYVIALLPALLVMFGVGDMAMLGSLLMLSAFLMVTVRLVKQRSMDRLPLMGAVLLILFCEIGVMMHERYLFPALILLVMAYAIRRDRSILWLMIGLTVLTFLNVGLVLDRAIRIGGSAGHLSAPVAGIVSDSMALEYAIAALHTLMAGYALHVGLRQSGAEEPVRRITAASSAAGDQATGQASDFALRRLIQPRPAFRMDGKDWLILLAVTLLYAVLALTNLGDTRAPESAWVSERDSAPIVFDMGESRRVKLLYYGGIQWEDNDFDVSVSEDGESWTTLPAGLRYGDCYSWRYQTEKNLSDPTKYTGVHVVNEGRYLRLTAPMPDTRLIEILVRDADSGERVPLTLLSGPGEALIDEQDMLSGEPSWENSMYFDEIYHARTALEQLNAIRGEEPSQIYEISHPPLGKLLISFSLMIFGMNPFGWRFAGAMAGVLMLPAMYLIGKLFTRRRLFGLAAATLLALDCMHFAQTRIATIDSFATLFIIWSYYYMFRYALAEGYRKPLRHSLYHLLMSGLCMGLAIASKWTGMYAGVGLAVIFFWALWRRVREGMAADDLALMPGDEMPALDQGILSAARQWRRQTLITLAFCLFAFVLLPLVIYYVSFLPVFMQTSGGLTVRKVIDASEYMLEYHAEPGRGMDHYFYSPWYEWPLMIQPMWFYSGPRINGTGSTILTFGNPLVWWGGLAALLMTVLMAVKRPVRRWLGYPLDANEGADDIRPGLLVISFLAQYLPWALVPRGTYIYHYFPSVPFIVLCIALMLYYFTRNNRRAALWTTGIVLLVAALLFAAFFPFASGLRVSLDWLKTMSWFGGFWLYY